MTPMPDDRMPPLAPEAMDDAQRAAAAALIAGPRKAVKGPFVPLMRSPELMDRVQRVGEYLRFDSTLPRRVNEFATLVVAQQWVQQFEWCVHVPLALQAGTAPEAIEALRTGGPIDQRLMNDDEHLVLTLLRELEARRTIGDATYARALQRFGERGIVELVSLAGYFAMLSMVMNVAGTPPEPAAGVALLPARAGST